MTLRLLIEESLREIVKKQSKIRALLFHIESKPHSKRIHKILNAINVTIEELKKQLDELDKEGSEFNDTRAD